MPFPKGVYAAGDRYIQDNFVENIIKATGHFGKLSGDRNMVTAIYDCYVRGRYKQV